MRRGRSPNPEKNLEKEIFDALEERNVYVVKTHAGKLQVKKGPRLYWMQFAREGTPDLHFICAKKPCYMEIKTPEGLKRWEQEWHKYGETKKLKESNRRSVMQHQEHSRIRRLGGLVFIVSSKAQALAVLEEIKGMDKTP